MEHSLEKNLLNNFGGLDNNSLLNIINEYETDSDDISIFKPSPYYSHDHLLDFIDKENRNFTVLSLNVQSLQAKFNKILAFLESLKEKDFEYNAICLQETWLDNNANLSLLQIHNYTCISQGKYSSLHGGLIIYLHKRYNYTVKHVCNVSDIWEGLFIDIQKSTFNNHIILGNVYKPPKDNSNANIQTFNEEFLPVLEVLSKSKAQTLIAGDFNINLLQLKERQLTIPSLMESFPVAYIQQ